MRYYILVVSYPIQHGLQPPPAPITSQLLDFEDWYNSAEEAFAALKDTPAAGGFYVVPFRCYKVKGASS